jgi:hypothetical protein
MHQTAVCRSQVSPQITSLLERRGGVWLLLAAIVLSSDTVADEHSRLLELQDANTTYQGRLVTKNETHCYLLNPFGEMECLKTSDLVAFRVIAEEFRPASQAEFRRKLQDEFRTGYTVEASAHYVVVGPKGRTRTYCNLFENIYRQIVSFYSIRGFRTTDPESALVAIVFGTQQEFADYCTTDGVEWSKDLRGYYSLKSNRVVVYDDPEMLKSATATAANSRRGGMGTPAGNISDSARSTEFSSVAGETASIIVHETTHQVGFNIGIHSRISETPAWLIEGLATVLEAPGIRGRSKSSANRLNPSRLAWFSTDYSQRRQPGDLAKLIASDEMFQSQPLDAYSTAWAFSYFLSENPARARLFARYLKKVSERPPMTPYPPEERLKDLKSVMGDISRLEVDFLRAADEWDLESQPAVASGTR